MPKFINGPTNYVQLKGKINNIEKNIYLFFDTHYKIDNQTRCESFDSIDISYYLYKKIQKTKEPLEFFMEVKSSELCGPISNKRDIYINEVTNLFRSEFIIETIDGEEIIRHSKTNPNVRLHYLDIRDHLNLFLILDMIKVEMLNNVKLLFASDNLDYIDELKNNIILIKNKIDSLKKNIREVKKNNQSYDKKINTEKYYLNKVINRYSDEKLKNYINEFIEINNNNVFYNINICIEELLYYIEDYNNEINLTNKDTKLIEIKKLIDIIYEGIIDIYTLLTDGYLLRRLIDKNYIKNSVIYTGSQHSTNYIFFLVKYYNFEIIKVYDSIEKDIKKINDIIRNSDYVFRIYKLFRLKEPNRIQCVQYEPLGIENK